MPNPIIDREVVINVNGVRISSRLLDESRVRLGLDPGQISPILKVEFKVTKTLKKDPNEAEVSIWNLKKDNRVRFQTKQNPTIIEAGYSNNTSIIFSGNIEFGQNKLDGSDWITTMQAGDFSKRFKGARINRSFSGPVDVLVAVRACANALQVGDGNIADIAFLQGRNQERFTEFKNGIVLSGKAEQQLDKIAKSLGLSWSVQDGKLFFTSAKTTIDTEILLISAGTGMIGGPEPGDKGTVKVRTQLQPELLPGKRVVIRSREINGQYRIDKSEFVGDTWGDDWFVDIEGTPI